MSEELTKSIALWVIIPAFCGILLLLIITAVQAVGGRRSTLYRNRKRQLAELHQMITEVRGPSLEVDWMNFKNISDAELDDLLGEHGWQYQGEEITAKSWLLRFELQPSASAGPDSCTRLRTELENAVPSVDGNYLLDTSEYMALDLQQIKRSVNATGWLVASLDHGSARPQMRLARKGSHALSQPDRTFVQGSTPDRLRRDPAVATRAEEIRRTQGFDPLSDRELDHARQRHQYWQKKFNRQVALASLYTIVGGVLLAAFFASDEPDWESGSAYVLLAIPLILLLLAGIAIYKAVRVRKARRVDIGAFLDAYEELNRLAGVDTTPGR